MEEVNMVEEETFPEANASSNAPRDDHNSDQTARIGNASIGRRNLQFEFNRFNHNTPLTHVNPISPSIIRPYRLLVFARIVAIVLFLSWRVRNPNSEAMWLRRSSITCEIWLLSSWILNQVPKLFPVKRDAYLRVLKLKFPEERSDLPRIDVFVTTEDPDKEPPLVTANTILSILAVDYPVEKVTCYLSDDGGSLLTYEALQLTSTFAKLWVPFCRKHQIEPRNPEAYFQQNIGILNHEDMRYVKLKYQQFKEDIHNLPQTIKDFNDRYSQEEFKKKQREAGSSVSILFEQTIWMSDGSGHWQGTWPSPKANHLRGDHGPILQEVIQPPEPKPRFGTEGRIKDVDIRLPLLFYVSREKRPGYADMKKAGALNTLTRVSKHLSNGPFILNLDYNQYIYNSLAIREGMCYLLDKGGENISYVQYPLRFDGVDLEDRYANHKRVLFDVGMRGLDGLQGPIYMGSCCIFRRTVLNGSRPPGGDNVVDPEDNDQNRPEGPEGYSLLPIVHPDASSVALRPEVRDLLLCYSENRYQWGIHHGWIYDAKDLTGYRIHSKGWKSVYSNMTRDAFRMKISVNLTDSLYEVLERETGYMALLLSKNSPIFAQPNMPLLQRLAYFNMLVSPLTSVTLMMYCFLPAISLFSGKFIFEPLSTTSLMFFVGITIPYYVISLIEIKWAEISLQDWWTNEQFWFVGGTSASAAAVLLGVLKAIVETDISFTPTTSKSDAPIEDGSDDEFYVVKWTLLMVLPIAIIVANIIAIPAGLLRIMQSTFPQRSKSELVAGVTLSLFVLIHLYPFAKGLIGRRMGRRGRFSTIVYLSFGSISLMIAQLWVLLYPPP